MPQRMLPIIVDAILTAASSNIRETHLHLDLELRQLIDDAADDINGSSAWKTFRKRARGQRDIFRRT